jgi:hypothetical protein
MTDDNAYKFLRVLERIAQSLEDIAARGGSGLGGQAATPASGEQKPGAVKSGLVASDSDLDGQHGDPTIRKDPPAKYWTGQSYVGAHMSECPAEYLDTLAKYYDACAYMAQKTYAEETDPKKLEYKQKDIKYKPRDAGLARGWAKRMRDGLVTRPAAASETLPSGQAPKATGYDFNDDDMPF